MLAEVKLEQKKKVKLGSYFNNFLWSWCCAQKLVLLFSHISVLLQRRREYVVAFEFMKILRNIDKSNFCFRHI